MLESSKFKDMNITLINKGWSDDQKYLIITENGEKQLLRTSDIKHYEAKKNEFIRLKEVSNLDILCSQPIDFGVCEESQKVWMLLTWIEGEDLEGELAKLSEKKQYELGIEAGKALKQLHSLPAKSDVRPWEHRFNEKIDRKIKMYLECGLKIDGDEVILDYIENHRHLLENRPQSFHHGDFHVGNMLLTPEGELAIIDFNRMDDGDPWEEFNRIVFCSAASPAFAAGRVNGYFDGEPPREFFQLLVLYISSNTLGAIAWAIPFGAQEVKVMTNQAKQFLHDYHNMDNVIPRWYQETMTSLG